MKSKYTSSISIIFFIAVIAIYFFLSDISYGQNVTLTPKRLFLDEGQRSGVIKVFNTTDESQTYKVSMVSRVFDEYGKGKSLDIQDLEKQMRRYIRFSPKVFTIGPKGYQSIRVMASNIDELEKEPNIRLNFTPISEDQKKSQEVSDDMKIALKIEYSLTIPILIHNKGMSVENEVAVADFKDYSTGKSHAFNMTLENSGEVSSGVDITFFGVNKSGEAEEVGKIKDIYIYKPQTIRKFDFILPENLLKKEHVKYKYEIKPSEKG